MIRGLLVQKVNWLIDQWEQNSYGKLSIDVALQNSIGLTQSAFYEKSAPYVFSVFEATKP